MKLKLNDFEGFDRYLFGEEKPDWKRFYNKRTDTFEPPIGKPTKEVEYQLDHYTLWMVISHFALRHKPIIFKYCGKIVNPICRCYACEWRLYQRNDESCIEGCPLIGVLPTGCTMEWRTWAFNCKNRTDVSDDEKSRLAKQIAMTPWRKVKGGNAI